jgi:hypothetical protein
MNKIKQKENKTNKTHNKQLNIFIYIRLQNWRKSKITAH